MTPAQAYDKGWKAYERSETGDLEAAEDKFGRRNGRGLQAFFSVGWIDRDVDATYGESLPEQFKSETNKKGSK